MTKTESIEKTLKDIGPRFEVHQAPHSEEPDHEEIVIATLRERLPESHIKTCEDFSYLKVECCETCHRFYPHFEMSLIDLQDGAKASVCDPVKGAIYSESLRQAEHR